MKGSIWMLKFYENLFQLRRTIFQLKQEFPDLVKHQKDCGSRNTLEVAKISKSFSERLRWSQERFADEITFKSHHQKRPHVTFSKGEIIDLCGSSLSFCPLDSLFFWSHPLSRSLSFPTSLSLSFGLHNAHRRRRSAVKRSRDQSERWALSVHSEMVKHIDSQTTGLKLGEESHFPRGTGEGSENRDAICSSRAWLATAGGSLKSWIRSANRWRLKF